MRVGLVVDNFPVLSESFVINMAAGLLERGHDVRILALDGQRPADAAMHGTVARLGLEARVSRPVAGGVLVRPFTRAPDAADPATRWSLLRRGSAFAAQGAMFAKHRPFDVVHCQFATLGLQVLRHARLGTLRHAKLVVHLRGIDISEVVAHHGPRVYDELFAAADLLVANCEHFRQRAIELGAEPHKVIVIGSAIDASGFPLKTHGGEGTGAHIVSVGRLVEKKGYAHAIAGVAAAARRHQGISYEIIGEGPLRGELEAQIDALGMTGRITLAGAMAHEAMAERLSAADLMIATSVRSRSGDEDAPVNSLKEGMATGLPVIGSRHGGIPELVEDAIHGALVPEGDSEAIAAAIARLLANRDEWPEMGRRGREKVLATYDRPAVTERLLASYRMLFEPEEGLS